MKHLLRTLALTYQIVAARRHAEFLMAGPTRVWPEPGRRPEPAPDAVETPVYGPDVLLPGDDIEWHEVSGCVCVTYGTRHLVCPAHPEDDA